MFRKGKVVAVYPRDHAVDVVMVDDGSRLAGVQCMSASAGSRSGVHNMPVPDEIDGDGRWDMTKKRDSEVIALIGFINNRTPVVVGFMFPQIGQMTFDDMMMSLNRHPSDVYHSIDKSGNSEFYHPSGAYIRIAEDTAHKDLTGKDFDKKFKTDRNTDKKVHIHVEQAGGKAIIDIDPDGNLIITVKGTAKIHSDKDMELSSGTHIKMTAPRIDLN